MINQNHRHFSCPNCGELIESPDDNRTTVPHSCVRVKQYIAAFGHPVLMADMQVIEGPDPINERFKKRKFGKKERWQ